MGGNYHFDYVYDHLNRLASSAGNFTGDPSAHLGDYSSTYDMSVAYNKTGGIIQKNQGHQQNGNMNNINSYNNEYQYQSGTHKVDTITDLTTGQYERYHYDNNGNPTAIDKDGDNSRLYWDEADRLKAVNREGAGIFQYYAYDDAGDRIIKSNIEQGAQLYQNGQVMDPGSFYVTGFKVYPNAYHVQNSDNRLTKHYYAGNQRVASRIMDFDFSVMKSSGSKSEKGADTKEADLKQYLEKARIDFTQLKTELAKGPVQQDGVYYLHGDHLGTATFVTEHHGLPSQFFLNLPFGETMAEQMTGIYNNPYKFNAKELDDETGLYYYGARYYNPRLSMWYGVDPLAEKMPSWSPYVYTFDNPVRFTDPDGMAPKDIIYLNNDGSINRVVNNGSKYITLVHNNKSLLLGNLPMSNAYSFNMKASKNVIAYYGSKIGATNISTTSERSNNSTAYYNNDGGIVLMLKRTAIFILW